MLYERHSALGYSTLPVDVYGIVLSSGLRCEFVKLMHGML